MLNWTNGNDMLNPRGKARQWMVRDLQIAPGRPSMFFGPAGSCKTTAVHALVMSVLHGTNLWGQHPVRQGSVIYLDYEMGRDDTEKMLAGHGKPNENLWYSYCPGFYLEEANGPYLESVCMGRTLCVVDSLLMAMRVDPNHPSARAGVDMLAGISVRTGCSFVIIHHANRQGGVMGSAGFEAACGSVFKFERSKSGARVEHKKSAGARGIIPAFELGVQIHVNDGDDYASSINVFVTGDQKQPKMATNSKVMNISLAILEVLAEGAGGGQPSASSSAVLKEIVRQRLGSVGNDAFQEALQLAQDTGMTSCIAGLRGAHKWTITEQGLNYISKPPVVNTMQV